MYALIHDHPDCGAIAFLLTYRPTPGSPKTSRGLLHTNGQPFEYGRAPTRCDYCCGMITPTTRDIRQII